MGILTSFVDDMAYGSTPSFCSNILDRIKETFRISSSHTGAFDYIGISVVQNDDYSITIDQIKFINTIQPISIAYERRMDKLASVTESERKELRSAIGQLSWAAGISRPDISFAICQLSTIVNSALVTHLIEANKLIKYIQTEPVAIMFPKLNIDSLHVTLYCDASFRNLPDGGSQGGHIVFLCDDEDNCCPIAWSSKKIKRIVHSTLAAETLSMEEGTGTAFYVLNILSDIVPCCKTINVVTDNKSLYDTTHSKKPTIDKRLRVDIAGIKEMLEKKEIDIKAVPGKEQLSDVLTKKGASPHMLLSVLRTGKLYMVSK